MSKQPTTLLASKGAAAQLTIEEAISKYEAFTKGEPRELESETDKQVSYQLIFQAYALLLGQLSAKTKSNLEISAKIYAYLAEHSYYGIGIKENKQQSINYCNLAIADQMPVDCIGKLRGQFFQILHTVKEDNLEVGLNLAEALIKKTKTILTKPEESHDHNFYAQNILAKANLLAARLQKGIHDIYTENLTPEILQHYKDCANSGMVSDSINACQELAAYYQDKDPSEALSYRIMEATILTTYDSERYPAKGRSFFYVVALINELMQNNAILKPDAQASIATINNSLRQLGVEVPCAHSALQQAFRKIRINLPDLKTAPQKAQAVAAQSEEGSNKTTLLLDISHLKDLVEIVSNNNPEEVYAIFQKIAASKNFPDNLTEEEFNDIMLAIYQTGGVMLSCKRPTNREHVVSITGHSDPEKFSNLLQQQLERRTKLSALSICLETHNNLISGDNDNARRNSETHKIHSPYARLLFIKAQKETNPEKKKNLYSQCIQFSLSKISELTSLPLDPITQKEIAYLHLTTANSCKEIAAYGLAKINFNFSQQRGNLMAGVELYRLHESQALTLSEAEIEANLTNIKRNIDEANKQKIITHHDLKEIESAEIFFNYYQGLKAEQTGDTAGALEFFKKIGTSPQCHIYEYYDGIYRFFELSNLSALSLNAYLEKMQQIYKIIEPLADNKNFSSLCGKICTSIGQAYEAKLALAKANNATPQEIKAISQNITTSYQLAAENSALQENYYASYKLGKFIAENLDQTALEKPDDVLRDDLRTAFISLIFAAFRCRELEATAQAKVSSQQACQAIADLLENRLVANLVNNGLTINYSYEVTQAPNIPQITIKSRLQTLEDQEGTIRFTRLLDAAKTTIVEKESKSQNKTPAPSSKSRIPAHHKSVRPRFVLPTEPVVAAEDSSQETIQKVSEEKKLQQQLELNRKAEEKRAQELARQAEARQKQEAAALALKKQAEIAAAKKEQQRQEQLRLKAEKLAQEQRTKQQEIQKKEKERQAKIVAQKQKEEQLAQEEKLAQARQQEAQRIAQQEQAKLQQQLQQEKDAALVEQKAQQTAQEKLTLHQQMSESLLTKERDILNEMEFEDTLTLENALVKIFQDRQQKVKKIIADAKIQDPQANEFRHFEFYHDSLNNSMFDARNYSHKVARLEEMYHASRDNGIIDASLALAVFYSGKWSACNIYRDAQKVTDYLAEFATGKKTNTSEHEDQIIENLVLKNILPTLENPSWMQHLKKDLQINLAKKIVAKLTFRDDCEEFLAKFADNLTKSAQASRAEIASIKASLQPQLKEKFSSYEKFWNEDYSPDMSTPARTSSPSSSATHPRSAILQGSSIGREY